MVNEFLLLCDSGTHTNALLCMWCVDILCFSNFSHNTSFHKIISPAIYTHSIGHEINLNQLPDPILIRIFEYLSPSEQIETVCNKWNFSSKYAWTKFHSVCNFSFSIFRNLPAEVARKINSSKFITLHISRCGKYLNCTN